MAKTDIWMPLYINDYLSDTLHLSAEESGAYLFLIMHYWKKGKISGDIEKISRISRCSIEITQSILDEFFEYENKEWNHSRINKELSNASTRRESAIENGKKGGRPKKINNPTPNPEKTHSFSEGIPTNNPTPNPEKSSSPTPSSSPITTKTPKPLKHKYGEYKNVLLSDTEYTKLSDEWGISERDRMINTLSEGIERKGYKYKSHYLALRKWKDNEKSGKPDQYNMGTGRDIEGFC